MEFKGGDRVKFIGTGCGLNSVGETNGSDLTIGEIYTVKTVNHIQKRGCARKHCRIPLKFDIGALYQSIELVEANQIYCNAIFVPASRRVRRVKVRKSRDGCRLPDAHEWLKVLGR